MTGLLLPVMALGAGLVMALLARPVLLRLPEPAGAEDKTAYRELPTRRFVLCCALAAMAAQVLAVLALPPDVLPLWTVLATAGVLLAAIDARTTWLPLTLTQAAWSLMVLAAGSALGLGLPAADLLRAVAGAGIAGTLYLTIWAVTRGGFGFGDVRFAPLLGAATGSHSWSLLIWGLTLGTAVGAIHGAVRLVGRRVGGFPYAPSMLVGSYLAVLALTLLPRA
jgi:leader peptidase (prepilin peptidase)/N-methyltransferase